MKHASPYSIHRGPRWDRNISWSQSQSFSVIDKANHACCSLAAHQTVNSCHGASEKFGTTSDREFASSLPSFLQQNLFHFVKR